MPKFPYNFIRACLCLAAFALSVSFGAAPAFAKLTTSDAKCLGTQRCTKLSNGTVDVLVTRDVGPRVISYSFTGAGNVFAEMPAATIEPARFSAWGGHRLWHAPEQAGRSYVPDNTPPQMVEIAPGHVRLTAPAEAATLPSRGHAVCQTHDL